MLSTRANTICLLEILKEFSDEHHILPMSELISKMSIVYGLNVDRRTVYSSMALLIELGYDISIYEDNGVGYYLRGREFDQTEIMLLTDAVYSFPFIPAHQSEHLIKKLQNHLSTHKRKLYRHMTLVRDERKTDNRQVFLNIELLDEAISNKQQVSFVYLSYGTDKKLHPRRSKEYIVNPYGITYMNERYYLICNLSGFEKTSLYRIDLIKDVKNLDSKWDRSPGSKSEVSKAIYAFTGESERIVMHCDANIIGDVIDKFGTSIHINTVNEKTVEVSFDAPPRGIHFWALQYLRHVEVKKPLWLRDEIIESINKNKYQISTDKNGGAP